MSDILNLANPSWRADALRAEAESARYARTVRAAARADRRRRRATERAARLAAALSATALQQHRRARPV